MERKTSKDTRIVYRSRAAREKKSEYAAMSEVACASIVEGFVRARSWFMCAVLAHYRSRQNRCLSEVRYGKNKIHPCPAVERDNALPETRYRWDCAIGLCIYRSTTEHWWRGATVHLRNSIEKQDRIFSVQIKSLEARKVNDVYITTGRFQSGWMTAMDFDVLRSNGSISTRGRRRDINEAFSRALEQGLR